MNLNFERKVLYLGYSTGLIQRDNKTYYTIQMFDFVSVTPCSVNIMEDKHDLVDFFVQLEPQTDLLVTFNFQPDKQQPKLYKLRIVNAELC